MTHLKPSQYIVAASAAFALCLIPCVAERPQLFQTNHGISDYGVNRLTVIPFSAGMVASIALLMFAARVLSRDTADQRMARVGLTVVAALQLGLFLVPDFRNKLARHIHIGFGVTVFVVEFVLSVWFAVIPTRRPAGYLVLFIMAMAGIFSFLSLIHSTGILPQSEIVFQLAFMALGVMGLRRIE